MKEEELETLIQEVSESLDKLSKSDQPLPKEERNHKQVPLLQRETLKRIREAKEKGDWHQEMKAGIDYALLTSYGEKHPFLMYFIKSQSGWNVF